MTQYKAPLRDMRFLMNEVLDYPAHYASLPNGKDADPEKITHEVADLWFHCLVLLARHGLSPDDVLRELARRHGKSGLAEKASRRR